MSTERKKKKKSHPDSFNWFLESTVALEVTTNTGPLKQSGWSWKGGQVPEGKEEVAGWSAGGGRCSSAQSSPFRSTRYWEHQAGQSVPQELCGGFSALPRFHYSSSRLAPSL